jgi:hypothetical protein
MPTTRNTTHTMITIKSLIPGDEAPDVCAMTSMGVGDASPRRRMVKMNKEME